MRPLKYSVIAIALLLLSFMIVGVVLPGEWIAEASLEVPTSPDEAYPLIADLRRWDEWTSWGDVESTFEGSARGAGATRSWSTEDFGSGRIEITAASDPFGISYLVDVDSGALQVRGRIDLEVTAAGTMIRWKEAGDFGWNPLMGYQARFMARAQGAQLHESLERLAAVLEAAAR